MKALTLTQPWATLVAIGAKKIETRSWGTNYRGPLAIHAGAGFGPAGGKRGYQALCAEEPFNATLTAYMQAEVAKGITPLEAANLIPLGAIVALVNLDYVERILSPHDIPDEPERSFGNYELGRYAWHLTLLRKFDKPIPAKGAQGFWAWDETGA